MKFNPWKIAFLLLAILLVGIGVVFLTKKFDLTSRLGAIGTQPVGDTMSVKGQVFIVTKGGVNFKLGLVEVLVVKADALTANLDSKKTEIISELADRDRKCNECVKLVNDFTDFRSGKKAELSEVVACQEKLTACGEDLPEILIQNIPANALKARTDADGAFALTLSRGTKYTILARGRRSVGSKEEKYYWMEDYDTSNPPGNIILSNNNLLDPKIVKLVLSLPPSNITSNSNQ